MLITLLAGLPIYAAIQMVYDLCTLIGDILFRHDAEEWPPVFDQPWMATNPQFLGKGWHQMLKVYFVGIGTAPATILSFVLPKGATKALAVLGVFLTSGILHSPCGARGIL